MSETLYRVSIEPLDPILFGDSRSARAGADHLLYDQDPSPVTIFGALGQDVAVRAGGWEQAGPYLGTRVIDADVLDLGDAADRPFPRLLGYTLRDADGNRWFPNPLHARWLDPVGCELMAPARRTDAWTSSPYASLLFGDSAHDELECAGGWWIPEAALSSILAGFEPAGCQPRAADAFYRRDARIGINIDNVSGRAQEHLLFTRPYRAFAPGRLDPSAAQIGAALEAWYETTGLLPTTGLQVGFLGGDRRRAAFTWEPLAARGLAEIYAEVADPAALRESSGLLAYLLTPMPAPDDYTAIRLPGVDAAPVAAAIGRGRWASGWDVQQRRPRPLISLLPAGSVFFFEWPEDIDRGSAMAKAWLCSLSARGQRVGFGRCLIGVWT